MLKSLGPELQFQALKQSGKSRRAARFICQAPKPLAKFRGALPKPEVTLLKAWGLIALPPGHPLPWLKGREDLEGRQRSSHHRDRLAAPEQSLAQRYNWLPSGWQECAGRLVTPEMAVPSDKSGPSNPQ